MEDEKIEIEKFVNWKVRIWKGDFEPIDEMNDEQETKSE